jgi:hypothetical protein
MTLISFIVLEGLDISGRSSVWISCTAGNYSNILPNSQAVLYNVIQDSCTTILGSAHVFLQGHFSRTVQEETKLQFSCAQSQCRVTQQCHLVKEFLI